MHFGVKNPNSTKMAYEVYDLDSSIGMVIGINRILVTRKYQSDKKSGHQHLILLLSNLFEELEEKIFLYYYYY